MTANARTLPARTCGAADDTVSTPKDTSPPIIAVINCALPLYGTGIIFAPAASANISPARCGAEPGPKVPYISPPLLLCCLASVAASCTVLAANPFCANSTTGAMATMPMCSKLRNGSYGNDGFSAGSTVYVVLPDSSKV
ncbi:hypothetical protein D3C73_1343640 [compost metagenome]